MFPTDFSELLTDRGQRILRGEEPELIDQFNSGTPIITLDDAIDADRLAVGVDALDERLFEHLDQVHRPIDGQDEAPLAEFRTGRHQAHWFDPWRTGHTEAYKVAEELNLNVMMKSPAMVTFIGRLTGLSFRRPNRFAPVDEAGVEASCYTVGDHLGLHDDRRPDSLLARDGYVEFHVVSANDAVAHQYLVYEQDGVLTACEDVNVPAAINVYRLPFWHYVTPLQAKPGREAEARRWLLVRQLWIDRS